jgi:DNA modification methylase
VLRDDGTLFVNLGDSYCNADKWGGGGANTGKHTKAVDGEVPSWTAVRRKWSAIDGLKSKDLIGVPWMVALALRADGWFLRSDIIWSKLNPMPESVKDRPTKAHEYVFLLTKSPRYHWNADAIREKYAESTLQELAKGYDGEGTKDYDAAGVQNPSSVKARIVAKARAVRASVDVKGGNQGNGVMTFSGQIGANARTVWNIATEPSPYEHFAVMPKALARKCIMAGCPPGGVVLDPFAGMATTGVVALEEGRSFIGIELNPKYHAMARERLANVAPLLACEVPA